MRLIYLQADGLKAARDIRLSVPPLLAIHGPNGTGKTTLHQTILLSVLGYDPAMGRTLAATRKLSGGDGDIDIGLTFDNGFGIRRSFGRSGRTEVAPPMGEGTEAEKQERINHETGAFAPSFDLASMLALSAEKRRAALFALLPRDLAHLEEEEYRGWLGYGEAPDVIKRAIDKLWADQVNAASVSPTEGLASAIEFAHKQFLEADRDRQAAETLAADAEAKAVQMTEASAASADGDIAGLQVELSVVEQALGSLREKARGAERAVRVRQERDERIVALQRRIAAGAEHVASLLAQRDALTAPTTTEVERARQDVTIASDRSTETDRSFAAAEEAARSEASTAAEAASRAVATLDLHRRQLADLRGSIEDLGSHAACPTCGSADGLAQAVATMTEQVGALEALVASLNAEVSEAAVKRQEAEERVRSLQARRAAAREENDALTRAEEAKHAALVGAQDAMRRITHDIRQAEELLAQLKEEHARLTGEASEAPAPADPALQEQVAAQEAAASALREKIRALNDAAEAIGRAGAARERADRQRAELATITARAAALKRLYQGLQKYRGHVVRQMVAPVEEMANELLQRIDPAKQFTFIFEREGKDEFDFGFIEGGTFRGYDAASTGEDAFLAVVFVAALIAAVKPAWRVLLVDNAESIDDQRRRDLMEALARVSDQFDNVILLGCSPFDAVDGWVVMETAEVTGAMQMAGAA